MKCVSPLDRRKDPRHDVRGWSCRRQRKEPVVNVGEEICGEWLGHVKGCEFVQYNLRTPDVQGEIDVIGIEHRTVYCERRLKTAAGGTLQYTHR